MKNYNFEECTQSSMYDLFGLQGTFSSPTLDAWIQDDIVLSDEEEKVLRIFQNMHPQQRCIEKVRLSNEFYWSCSNSSSLHCTISL